MSEEKQEARIAAIRQREQKHLKFAPKAQTSLDTLWLIEQLESARQANQPRLHSLTKEELVDVLDEVGLRHPPVGDAQLKLLLERLANQPQEPHCTGPFSDARNCPVHAPQGKAANQPQDIDTQKLESDIMDFLGKWNAQFLLGRGALKEKLDKWLSQPQGKAQSDSGEMGHAQHATCFFCGREHCSQAILPDVEREQAAFQRGQQAMAEKAAKYFIHGYMWDEKLEVCEIVRVLRSLASAEPPQDRP